MRRRSERSAGPLLLRWVCLILLPLAILGFAVGAGASLDRPSPNARPVQALPHYDARSERAPARDLETLWIFDADFEDLTGDNAGWTSEDRSGTLAIPNHWHKDTIRIDGFEYLGDSTWWCGTYDSCRWRQPRGYGNDWNDILVRDFPEVATSTSPGDTLVLEYDQRIAMEKGYDYGYVEVSADGGGNWATVQAVTNPGFHGQPGFSQDWDSVNPEAPGHMSLDLSDYAGQEISIRFRFESDGAYSSQDSYDNPPWHSVLDGAWQLDNIKLWAAAPESVTIFYDDCEAPGDNGWAHDDILGHGQTGVTFWRGLYGTDIWTNRPFTCDEQEGWMYAAVDPLTSRMVDRENSWLISPPIDVSGASKLVGQWDMWVDLPRPTEDVFNLSLASYDDPECWDWDWYWDPWDPPGAWYGGPFWGTWSDDWDAFLGNPWLGIRWEVWNSDDTPPGVDHMGGIFINRQRVGIPVGDPGTTWTYSVWTRLHDWYVEQLAEAQAYTNAVINVRDDDDIAAVTLYADNGSTQSSYACARVNPEGNDWQLPPPINEIVPGAEIHYWFEAEDGVGNISVWPNGAPDNYYEFSILPITASTAEPGILLVDKHDTVIPGERRDYSMKAEDYYREALEILGYEFDVYDVEVPSGSTDQSNGPDSVAYKYYDTQIWFTGDFDTYTIRPFDQLNLSNWLDQASVGKERNLLFTGNNIASSVAGDSTGFLSAWLGVELLDSSLSTGTTDSLPSVRDVAGGLDFMTYDDGKCVLRGGCPLLSSFDVIQPYPGTSGAELALEYVLADLSTRPAAVAYTDSSGYQAVTLGFGMEFMSDALLPTGYFSSGAPDRVDLMQNIMDYFGETPTTAPTGVEDGAVFVNRLDYARPNPFNPSTTIGFSLATEGHVTLRVYNAAGRLVRTIVDGPRAAGPQSVVWDGSTDSGLHAASGVYFIRLETKAPGGFTATEKLILLK
jgi:hypothetical protein